MKKTLIALAALAATGAAFAQSSVTLYGRLDAGYSDLNTTVTAPGSEVSIKTSGIMSDQGLNTNLWGMKGSEDLGGGMKANFQLEAGLDSTTGAFNAGGFNRTSKVGLSGGFGSVDLGRDYTPLFSAVSGSDPFGATGVYSANLSTIDGVRASKAIHYTSPSFSGVTVKLMSGYSDANVYATVTAVPGFTTGATASAGANVRNTGASVGYANGPLSVTLAAGSTETQVGQATPLVAFARAEGSALAANYDFGVAKLMASFVRAKNTDVSYVIEQTEANLGVVVPMGKVTVLATYGRNTLTAATVAGAAQGDGSGNDYVLGVTYDLSKRTALYAKTGTVNKLDFTSAAGANYSMKTTGTAIGVRHSF